MLFMEQWKDSATLLIWLITGCIVILIFVAFIIIFGRTLIRRIRKEATLKQLLLITHQKELLNNSVQSEEKEKKRIALQLHDDVLANLHRVKLLNNDPKISQLLSQSMDKIRHISHDLIPPLLEEMPFDEFMNDFLSFLEAKYSLYIHSVRANTELLNPNTKLQLFRIFQALTVNVLKHSHANEINILWKRTYNYSCLILEDNGVGIPKNLNKKGLGLKNIEMRTKIINGTSRFKSKPDKGTRFIILIPTIKND
ncbi:MAG: two-component system NarL family sensor kinase [Crocinitomix sp.]